MKSLNQRLFEVAYEHQIEQFNKVFIGVYTVNKPVVTSPVLRPFVRKFQHEHPMETIILNVTPTACELQFLEEGLWFKGRFAGKLGEELIPWENIWNIYSPADQDSEVPFPRTLFTPAKDTDGGPQVIIEAKPKANPFTVVK